jgi:ABC-type transporter Mla maintaining outer membrane lipid asymmetry permease subunit MlaE
VNMLERNGGGTIHGLADVGELSLQFWAGLRVSPSVLPVVGKRARWQTAIRQMSATDVDALPMIGIVAGCAGFIFAMQSAAD